MVTTTTSSDPNKICNHPGLNPDPHNPRDCGVYYSCKPAPNYPGKCFPVVEFLRVFFKESAIRFSNRHISIVFGIFFLEI